MMKESETEKIEYKRKLTENFPKEVLAFANSDGGSIYIGVEDDGTVTGVSDPDGTMQSIRNMLHDSIHPDIMMFVHIGAEEIDQHTIIHVRVAEGTNKPYYLVKYGLKPSGVFVRQGTASVQASTEPIRQMIKQADGDVFEENISLEQDLSFRKTETVFSDHNLPFGRQQMQTLGILRDDQMFTNLGLLLSDQCPFTIKAAIFAGADQMEFQDRREFSGSLFEQLEACYEFLQLQNPLSASFEGLYRKDSRPYPDSAIREALLNSIIHRDYSYQASTFVSTYPDRMEFLSVGGLMPGITEGDILLGLSVCRNRKLADIFYRLDLIEAYGTGLLKIRNAYRDSDTKPQILTASNSFKTILPHLVLRKESEKVERLPGKEEVLPGKEESIIRYLEEHHSIVRKDAESLLQVSSTTAVRILKKMADRKMLLRLGEGRNTHYILPDDKC